MTRRFVIGIDKLAAEQDKAFNEFLHTFGGYWHWVENLWLLVVEGEENINATLIRDKVTELDKTARVLVLEVGADVDWAGRGARNASGRSQHEWLAESWVGKSS